MGLHHVPVRGMDFADWQPQVNVAVVGHAAAWVASLFLLHFLFTSVWQARVGKAAGVVQEEAASASSSDPEVPKGRKSGLKRKQPKSRRQRGHGVEPTGVCLGNRSVDDIIPIIVDPDSECSLDCIVLKSVCEDPELTMWQDAVKFRLDLLMNYLNATQCGDLQATIEQRMTVLGLQHSASLLLEGSCASSGVLEQLKAKVSEVDNVMNSFFCTQTNTVAVEKVVEVESIDSGIQYDRSLLLSFRVAPVPKYNSTPRSLEWWPPGLQPPGLDIPAQLFEKQF